MNKLAATKMPLKQKQIERLTCMIELLQESTDKLNRRLNKLKELLLELQEDKEAVPHNEAKSDAAL